MQEDMYICIYVILCIFLELQINMIILARPPQPKISAYAPESTNILIGTY